MSDYIFLRNDKKLDSCLTIYFLIIKSINILKKINLT